MTASLTLYRIGTRLLEPLAPALVRRRVRSGKERADRAGERFGRTQMARPDGPLLWMHGASVGESRLLLDIFEAIRERRPDAHALVTTQTTTSADMIAAKQASGVIHQMAPLDGPGAVRRFLQHWRPDAAVFAEGEIWPNMLTGLRRAGIPAALANARMTQQTLEGWKSRKASARKLFAVFGFIGAADRQTAEGLAQVISRDIATIGNLKMAATVTPPAPEPVAAFRQTVSRPILLAASTHPGEDDFALDAFAVARADAPDALLVIVPRHPDRGDTIIQLAHERGFASQQWSRDARPPGRQTEVLVADTIGQLLFWYAVADGIYLGGATREGVGGHNAIEPAQLGRRVFTGPHGFNFRETFEILARAGAVSVGASADELAAFWGRELAGSVRPPLPAGLFDAFREPFERTVDAIVAMLPARSRESGDA